MVLGVGLWGAGFHVVPDEFILGVREVLPEVKFGWGLECYPARFILLDEEVAEGACQDALDWVVVHDSSEAGESGGAVHEVCREVEEEVSHVPDCQVHEFDRVSWPF